MNHLKASPICTCLGTMLAIADEESLYFLDFLDTENFQGRIEWLKKQSNFMITLGSTKPIISIRKEISEYFNGCLKTFKTPINCFGSTFQKKIWLELEKIPYGQTSAYSHIAERIQNPKACRAVALANAANLLLIVVPCHRVISLNGQEGGYRSGVARKKWLINHEKQFQKTTNF